MGKQAQTSIAVPLTTKEREELGSWRLKHPEFRLGQLVRALLLDYVRTNK